MAMNVEVEVVSAGSVRVSWDSLDIPEITGYIIYYSQTGSRLRETHIIEHSLRTSNFTSIVVIRHLDSQEYQFQVAAIAELDGDVITGERSTPSYIAVPVEPTTTISPVATQGLSATIDYYEI